MSIMTTIKVAVTFLWVWLVSLLLPLWQYMAFTCVLVVADFITGVAAARTRGEELNSRGFRRTVTKIVMYFIAILLTHGMHIVFFEPYIDLKMVWIVSGFIGLSEFKSNLENIATVTGLDIWKRVAMFLPDWGHIRDLKDNINNKTNK